MDPLCRVCIEKVAKCTSLSSKIEESSNLSFFDFLNKCTTVNAREGDSLPQSLCSVCDNAMRMFYSFTKQAEKSDLILREALKKLVAEGRYNGHKETPSEESAKRKEIMPTKNSTRSSVYILDFVKEEPRVSDSTSIVAVKQVGINESEHFESSLNQPEESNEEPDHVLSRRDRLAIIDAAELTDSENDIPTSALIRKLAKSEDEGDSQSNSCEEITIKHETIGEESEDFNQDDSFHCQPSKNSTGSLPYMLDIVKEEPRVSESTSIVAVKDAVINESENLESNLDNPGGTIEEFCDILSCNDSHSASIDTEHIDFEDYVPISVLKKRLTKNGDEADSQSDSINILIEQQKYHKNNRLKCVKCDKEFKNIGGLRQHLHTHADPLKRIKCKHCGTKLKHMHGLRRHMQLHTNPNRFKCEKCKKVFVNESSYSNHSCFKGVYDKNKKFKCEICGKKFSKNYLQLYHMETHKGTKSKCNLCGKEFLHRYNLNKHMIWHNNPEACKCEICGKSLASKESYARHMDTVHPEQSEKSKKHCGICGKSFSTNYFFDVHMEKHKRITPKCHICGKEFKQRNNLNRHINLHNNPKPFKCEKCGQLFDRKNRYNSHIEICEHAGKQQQLKTQQLPIRSRTNKVVMIA